MNKLRDDEERTEKMKNVNRISLPSHVRSCETLTTFRRYLKYHTFFSLSFTHCLMTHLSASDSLLALYKSIYLLACLLTYLTSCVYVLLQMGIVSTLHATIIDKFKTQFPEGRRRILLLLVICFTQFILALSLCTNVSHYARRFLV